MSIESLGYSKESQENSNEKLDRKEYEEICKTKEKISRWVQYLSEDPARLKNFDKSKNFGELSIKDAIKESREYANGIGAEKIPGFIKKTGELFEKVEYVNDQIIANFVLGNERMTISISDFQKNTTGNWREEQPVNVKISGNMTKENKDKLLSMLNISKNFSESKLGLAIIEKVIDTRKQETHGFVNKKQNEEKLQREKTIDFEYFLKILSIDKGDSKSLEDVLSSDIKKELGSERKHNLEELKLCSALVILGRSMSTQQILNKFDTESKTGDDIGLVSTLTQKEDILEYAANNPAYFAKHSDEIIAEVERNIGNINDNDDIFTQFLQS